MKALERNGPVFSFLCEKIPRLSTEKSKAGVFIGPQICQHFRDPQFDFGSSDDKKAAWNAFQQVATSFLGNVKAINLRKLVEDLITSYEELGCHMSLKVYFLHSHFSFCRLIVGPTVRIFTGMSERCRTDARADGVLPC